MSPVMGMNTDIIADLRKKLNATIAERDRLWEALTDEMVRLRYAGHGYPAEDRERFCSFTGEGPCPDCSAVDKMDAAQVGKNFWYDSEGTAVARSWARSNYRIGSDIYGHWHPVVQMECAKMNRDLMEVET